MQLQEVLLKTIFDQFASCDLKQPFRPVLASRCAAFVLASLNTQWNSRPPRHHPPAAMFDIGNRTTLQSNLLPTPGRAACFLSPFPHLLAA
jgi:hypothetical protein